MRGLIKLLFNNNVTRTHTLNNSRKLIKANVENLYIINVNNLMH